MSEIPLEEKQIYNPSISKVSSIKNDENGFNTKLYFEVPLNSGSNISSPRLNNLNLSNSIEKSTSVHNYLPDDLINKIDNLSPSTSPIEKNNILSSKVSDIETVTNKSDDSSIDDIQLIQYEDNKYTQPSNILINNDNLVKNDNINININSNSNNNPTLYNQNNYNIDNININNFNNNQYNSFESNNNIYHNLFNQNLINFNNEQNLFLPNFQIINNNIFNSINNFNQAQIINNWMINNQIIQMNNNITNNINNMNINNNINNNKNNLKQKKKKSKKKPKPYDDYTLEMFGRRGWICEECNNFNYESRNKCNRCGIPKQPKKIIRNKIKNENGEIIENIIKPEHKVDWCCVNCKNMNFSFRQTCNRCQMKKIDSENLNKNPTEN